MYTHVCTCIYIHLLLPTPPHTPQKHNNREGYPCRLYLDVEFDTRANPSLDGEKLMEEVLASLVRALLEVREEGPTYFKVYIYNYILT